VGFKAASDDRLDQARPKDRVVINDKKLARRFGRRRLDPFHRAMTFISVWHGGLELGKFQNGKWFLHPGATP